MHIGFWHLALVDKKDGRDVARAKFGKVQLVEVANRKVCLAFELLVAKCLLELARIAAASPGGAQVHDSPATTVEEVLQLGGAADLYDLARLHAGERDRWAVRSAHAVVNRPERADQRCASDE